MLAILFLFHNGLSSTLSGVHPTGDGGVPGGPGDGVVLPGVELGVLTAPG